MSWDHCVVSRKKTRISLATNTRTPGLAPLRTRSRKRDRARPSSCSAPSWARVKPVSKQRSCSHAPTTSIMSAVDQRKRKGNHSTAPPSCDMRASAAHSLGSQADVGVRRTATKSTRSRNSSGRTRRSGRRNRKSTTRPATAKSPTRARRSRVRRAGKTFTRRSVTALPSTAGMTRKGISTPRASR